jgi:hypothetical protein
MTIRDHTVPPALHIVDTLSLSSFAQVSPLEKKHLPFLLFLLPHHPLSSDLQIAWPPVGDSPSSRQFSTPPFHSTSIPFEAAHIRAFCHLTCDCPPDDLLLTDGLSRVKNRLQIESHPPEPSIRLPLNSSNGTPLPYSQDNTVKFYALAGRNSSLDGFRAFPRGQ